MSVYLHTGMISRASSLLLSSHLPPLDNQGTAEERSHGQVRKWERYALFDNNNLLSLEGLNGVVDLRLGLVGLDVRAESLEGLDDLCRCV